MLLDTHQCPEANLTQLPISLCVACQAQWEHSSLFPQFCIIPSASRTAFPMSNDDSLSIMPCYISSLFPGPQGATALFSGFQLVAAFYLHGPGFWQPNQSVSQPDIRAQPTSLCGKTSVTGAKESRWFINPAFPMIYIKVYDPPSWLKVMEGVEAARCTHRASWPSSFTLNDEVIDF